MLTNFGIGTLVAPFPLAADAAVESPARRALRRLLRRRGAIFGLAVLAVFVLLAVAAPWVTPYDPIAQSWMTPPLPGFATTLLLTAPLPGG